MYVHESRLLTRGVGLCLVKTTESTHTIEEKGTSTHEEVNISLYPLWAGHL